jgi:hypothetical protein
MTIEHRSYGKIIKEETSGQYFNRKNKRPNKPLRTIKEMAEEFDVSPQVLIAKIKNSNGPEYRYRTGGGGRVMKTWYDPDSLRKWWNELKKRTCDELGVCQKINCEDCQ